MTTSILIGILGFAFLLILIFNGFPIAIAMFMTAFLGFYALGGWTMKVVLAQFSTIAFTESTSYNYAVMPLFIVVGTLCGLTGIAEGAFSSVRTWMGRIKGGTLFTVIVANGIYGACSSGSTAGNIVFSRLSMPYLKEEGYDESLSLGTLCSSGALASLIPPSTGILMTCLIAPKPIMYMGKSINLSMGTGLICGIIPGIIMAVVLCLTVRLYGVFKKGSVPPASTRKAPLKEKLASIRFLLPILILFVIMIGGASLGFFTTTVAGAIGAVVCAIYAFVKRIPVKKVLECFWEACTMQGSMFLIIVAGSTFSRFIAMSGLTTWLGTLVSQMTAPPIILFFVVCLFYLIGGAVMNIVPLIVVTCSVCFTVLTSAGYHPYVILIVLVLMTEIAQMTPPIGVGTYMVANALRINPMKIFKAVIPFFLAYFVFAHILAIFPQLVLWLPTVMGML